MINSKPRFALLADGRLHDYVTGRVIAATGTVTDTDGTWDLVKVAALIKAGKHIETAHLATEHLEALQDSEAALQCAAALLTGESDPPVLTDKVDIANADFSAATPNTGIRGPSPDPADKVLKADADFLADTVGSSSSTGAQPSNGDPAAAP